MNERESSREAFAVCHEEFENLIGKQGWLDLAGKLRLAELFDEEIRNAEGSRDGESLWIASLDANELDKVYQAIGWGLHYKAAARGHLEAIRTLAEALYRGDAPGGENFDAALDWALKYIHRGGNIDDFKSFSLRPAHDAKIKGKGKTLKWLRRVAERAPSSECIYTMARCICDIDGLWMRSVDNRALDGDDLPDEALKLYRKAANAGFFWAQLNLGWYCLATGGAANTKDGLDLLEKALANIPDDPEPTESGEENVDVDLALARRSLKGVLWQMRTQEKLLS